MASDTQTSAIKIALAGWRDALRAITQMMPVAGAAFLFSSRVRGRLRAVARPFVIDFAVSPGPLDLAKPGADPARHRRVPLRVAR